MQTDNNKKITQLLDELNVCVVEQNKGIDVLAKEKDYLNNMISINKFQIENLSKDIAELNGTILEYKSKEQTLYKDIELNKLELTKCQKQIKILQQEQEKIK